MANDPPPNAPMFVGVALAIQFEHDTLRVHRRQCRPHFVRQANDQMQETPDTSPAPSMASVNLSRSSMRRMRQPDQFDDHCGNAPGLLLGDAGALKGTRDARLTVFEVGRGGGAVAERADDNRDDAFRVPGDQCWIGQGFG
jgi:hypothetical protein